MGNGFRLTTSDLPWKRLYTLNNVTKGWGQKGRIERLRFRLKSQSGNVDNPLLTGSFNSVHCTSYVPPINQVDLIVLTSSSIVQILCRFLLNYNGHGKSSLGRKWNFSFLCLNNHEWNFSKDHCTGLICISLSIFNFTKERVKKEEYQVGRKNISSFGPKQRWHQRERHKDQWEITWIDTPVPRRSTSLRWPPVTGHDELVISLKSGKSFIINLETIKHKNLCIKGNN